MQQMIALSKLELSPSNVRKSFNEHLIEQLAADIAARGLLQNLIVAPASKRGRFAVSAGGRRLKAMQLLVERGELDKDHEVPCRVITGSEAEISETSLAENFQREAMTPADECRAFQHFIDTDGSIDAVAKRFGVTRRFIESRLRLAALAEPIFDALASGEMTLDIAKAYASTDNHDRQLRVFASCGLCNSPYGYGQNADTIRRMIAQDSIRGDDPMALLVGEEAYLAAGGRIDRDLFTEQSEDRWSDPEIVERLAAEKLEAEAARLAADCGLAWIRPIASTDTYAARTGLYAVNLPPQPLTEEEDARLEAITNRMDAISGELEDEDLDDAQYRTLNAEYERLEDDRDELVNRPAQLPEERKAQVGQFLKLGRDGKMVLDTAYYSETPLRIEQDEEGGLTGTFEAPRQPATPPTAPSAPEAQAPGGKALSAKLFDELAVQRRDILAANMIRNPALALDLAIFALARKACHAELGTTITAPTPQDPMVGDIGNSRAREAIAAAHDALDTSWCEAEGTVARFEAFQALDDEAKAAWLAFSVAASLQAKPSYSQTHNPLQARLGALMEIDVAAWWRPTAANFFDRVPKGSLLQLLHEIGGPTLSSRYASSKKAEISPAMEKLFAGDAIVEDETRERALAWVPNAMRFLESRNEHGDILAGGLADDELAEPDDPSGTTETTEDIEALEEDTAAS